MQIKGLYAGKSQPFGPKGVPSALIKTPISEAQIGPLGIIDDMQADKRFHGGIEKALHQYSLTNYTALIRHYPDLKDIAVPGTIGENITVEEMDEHNTFIGDIYRIGEVEVQVSSPRIPCWKIAERYQTSGINQYIHEQGLTGWYYRVLQSGHISLGDAVTLIERQSHTCNIHDFMRVVNKRETNAGVIKSTANIEGLDPEWRMRLMKIVR